MVMLPSLADRSPTLQASMLEGLHCGLSDASLVGLSMLPRVQAP